MKKTIVLVLILIPLLRCTQPTVDTKAEGEKIMQLSREWSESASTKNLEKTVSYWADDAVVMTPGKPPLKGKKALRQMVEDSYQITGYHIQWQPVWVEVAKSGELAYLIKRSQITIIDSLGKELTERLRGVAVWKKQADGSWKEAVDITNDDPLP